MTKQKAVFSVLSVLLILILAAASYVFLNQPNDTSPSTEEYTSTNTQVPGYSVETIADGLSHVWEVAQAADGTIFFTERDNKISVIKTSEPAVIHRTEDAYVLGEGGMLGMALHPDFIQNRYMYVCFNTSDDIRVVRFSVSQDNLSLGQREDIITGMPANPSGRHSGCRLAFDSQDKYLWVGTGDTARSEHPQNPKSLGGKILRVDSEGNGVEGNLPDPFDPRIFSYGHRNTQGLAFYSSPRAGVIGYSSEHGPDVDDEINVLELGNFGWDPGAGYDESVPMTDLEKFPDAVPAIWSSGDPTIAVSGIALIEGNKWGAWQGNLLISVQKDRHIRMLGFDETGRSVVMEQKLFDNFGRIRTVVMGNDQAIFFSTDNGNGTDKIIKVMPKN